MIRLKFYSITSTVAGQTHAAYAQQGLRCCVARPAITDYDRRSLNQQFFSVRDMSLTK